MQKAIYDEDNENFISAEKLLETTRNRLVELIKKIHIPGIDLEIKDGTIHIDGYALNEYQLADSKIILAVSAILAKVNHKSPILVIGKLRELDDDNLAKLEKIARDNNCIIVGDYVKNNIENIVVEGFIPNEGVKDLPIKTIPQKTNKRITNLDEI
jgi:hypothetical protein